MFKYLTLVLVLLSTSVVADEGKWYIGIGLGQAEPQLELDKDVADSASIRVSGRDYEVPVSVDSEFTNYGQKLFVGYDVGDERGFAFELSLVNFGNYRGTLDTSIDDSGTINSEFFEDIPYTINLSGDQTITADLYATTFSTIFSFKITDRVSIFPRFGLSYIRGGAYIQNTITISAIIDNEVESITLREGDRDNIEAFLPMFGVGMDIQLNKHHFLRTEFERYGHPTEEYVDMYSVVWGYRF